MFKKIIGAALVGMVATQAFAYENVECRNAEERAKVEARGWTCAKKQESGPSATTLKRQQLQCKIEFNKLCSNAGFSMDPLEDSGCVIGKEKISNSTLGTIEQTNYLAYFNQRLKLVTVVDTASCKTNNTYFYQRISKEDKGLKMEVFDNKLFVLVNGKPMFFDNHAKLQELVSGQGNSYVLKGASIQDMEATVDGKFLKLERSYSKDSKSVQTIKIDAADLKDAGRAKAVHPSEFVHAYVPEIRADADIVR